MITRIPIARSALLALTILGLSVTSALCAGAKPAAPAAQPAVPPGWPKLLIIPRIGVKAPIEDVAFDTPIDSHAPFKWSDVAWYDDGPKPGAMGRATIFGHLDSTCCPAVFWNLKNLTVGDVVQVQYKNGQKVNFRVTWHNVFFNNKLPTSYLFGPTREHGLTLITCAGIFYQATGYDRKLIVYAKMTGISR